MMMKRTVKAQEKLQAQTAHDKLDQLQVQKMQEQVMQVSREVVVQRSASLQMDEPSLAPPPGIDQSSLHEYQEGDGE